jgi:hypothetical protein
MLWDLRTYNQDVSICRLGYMFFNPIQILKLHAVIDFTLGSTAWKLSCYHFKVHLVHGP